MAVKITHSTSPDGSFSATGAAAWVADHVVVGAAASGANSDITSLSGLTTPLSVGQGGSGTATPSLVAGAKIAVSGSWPNQTVATTGAAASGANSDITSLSGLTTPLSVGQGGSGTATPSLVAGTNVTISGTWPNQTINSTASSTLTVGTTATSGGAAGQIMFDTGAVLQESANLTWDDTNKYIQLKFDTGAYQLGSASDVILTRKAAANLRLGAADAATPVAQTLSVQNVLAGTTNTAGANLTITGSQGTGTGVGGSIIFQVAPAGTTGTAQNALATALTINNAKQIVVASSGTVAAPSLCLGNAQSGFYKLTNGFGYSTAISTTLFVVDSYTPGSGARILRDMHYGWTSAQFDGGTTDLYLTRRGAANLRFGAADAAAPVAQTLSVQSVVAGTTNTAGANFTITGSQGTGTGVGGDIIFQVAPAGTTGTAQNTLVTALRIYSNQTVAVGKAYTVATLPAAGTQGRRAWVTDALTPVFLNAVTGGGTVVCPVFDNGTNWVAG